MGSKPMKDFDDDSVKARVINARYNITKFKEMGLYQWNFAIKRIELTNDGNTPLYEFKYQFVLPSDSLRLLSIEGLDYAVGNSLNNGNGGLRLWNIEGRKLLTNEAGPINISYLYKNTTITEYPVEFMDAFTWRLAMDTAQKITNSDAKMEVMLVMYNQEIKKAKKNNAIQLANTSIPDSSWMNRW
jgi:hypothetical protein